jgi:hypothetical protein
MKYFKIDKITTKWGEKLQASFLSTKNINIVEIYSSTLSMKYITDILIYAIT